MAGLGEAFGLDYNAAKGANTKIGKALISTPAPNVMDEAIGAVKQGFTNAKAGITDPNVLAGYIRKGLNVDALTKASDWRMAGLDAMTGSSDTPRDVQRAGVDAGMNIAMNAPAMTVWHGSPHKFDKFDMSKIGTGEGAQAYGYGLYTAESKDIGNGYKDALSKDGDGFLYKIDIPDDSINKFLNFEKPYSEQSEFVKETIKNINKNGAIKSRNFNSWLDEYIKTDETGGGIYALISAHLADGKLSKLKSNIPEDVIASNILKENGIQGATHLDRSSKAFGKGTSNFVLFDDQMPRILEVNGQATGAQPWKPGEYQSAIANAFNTHK